MIADFGLTTILFNPGVSYATNTSVTMKGTVPWMAPELLDPLEFGLKHSKSTKSSDVYALGMLILEVSFILLWFMKFKTYYQVLTGKQPFMGLRSDSILYTVVSGRRPPRPEHTYSIGLSDNVWEVMGQCWLQIAEQRPNVSTVVKVLNEASRYWLPRLTSLYADLSTSKSTFI
jgi:serine/threonine protein kinase